jgi:hypothetical protein
MGREFDALDRIILEFEDTDRVERVKQAMEAGNSDEASHIVDEMTAEEIDKLAQAIPALAIFDDIDKEAQEGEIPAEPAPKSEDVEPTSTEEKAVNVEESSDPKPKNTDDMVNAGEELPENTMGDEKVDANVDEKNVFEEGGKEAQAGEIPEEPAPKSEDVEPTSTVEDPVDEVDEREEANEEAGLKEGEAKTAAQKTRNAVADGCRSALQKVAGLILKKAGITPKSKDYSKALETKINELTDALLSAK